MAEQVVNASVAIKWVVKGEPFRNEPRQLLRDARLEGITLIAPPNWLLKDNLDCRRREGAVTDRTLTLEKLKQQSLDSVLAEIAQHQSALTVRLPDGKEVTIAAEPHLEPLPELKGFTREGWKDAVYERS